MPDEKLIEALENQTQAINSFTLAIMELTQAVADMISMDAEDQQAPTMYLDGSEIPQ